MTEHELARYPPGDVDERDMLTYFLDYQRSIMVRKLDGLTEEQARATPTVSTLSLLGLLKHLADVEWWWFQGAIGGSPDERAREDHFHVDDGDSIESIVAEYEHHVAEARNIVAAASLDDDCRHPDAKGFSVRWVLVHLIEETSRHLGHADIIREALDGQRTMG